MSRVKVVLLRQEQHSFTRGLNSVYLRLRCKLILFEWFFNFVGQRIRGLANIIKTTQSKPAAPRLPSALG